MKALILFISLFIFISCNSKEQTDNDSPIGNFFDPGQPKGGEDRDGRNLPVIDLKADSSVLGQITLSWTVPGIYSDTDYQIYVYRVESASEDFTLPDPIGFLNGQNGYLSRNFETFQGNEYIDTNIQEAQEYAYFIYIYLNGKWSSEARVDATSISTQAALNIPSPVDFWYKVNHSYGNVPVENNVFLSTLDAGLPSIDSPKGKFAYAKDGQVLYILDSKRNRIMIYTTQAVLNCENFDPDSLEYTYCLAQYSGAPLQPFAVLGQSDFIYDYSCHDIDNELNAKSCLTNPKDIAVFKDNLVIATDDGVYVYDSLPVYGCFNSQNAVGIRTKKECEARKIIGRSEFGDYTSYDLSIHGHSALICPSAIAVDQGDLYIAEACDVDRIVKVESFSNDEENFCSIDNFGTSKCSFSAVLLQEDFYTFKNFSQEFTDTNIEFDFFNNTLSDNGEFLSKHCNNPSDIEFSSSGKMYVTCNEDFSYDYGTGSLELFGRILEYDVNPLRSSLPSCNTSTFHSTSNCQASRVFGQPGFNLLSDIPSGASYEQLTYTFKTIDIQPLGDFLFGVELERNEVYQWDLGDSRPLGNPISYRVSNPNGAEDTLNNTFLPDLQGLCALSFDANRKAIAIHDCLDSKIYEVNVIDFQ